ncbi:MAG: flagellar motor switch protein FliN [Desulfurobacteriaceae bacterium]
MEKDRLALLEDIPVTISVVLGKRKMLLKEVLELEQNQIITLNKYVDEPVDIYVNDRFFGYGEIVVENNKVGIRILSIVDEESND